MQEEIYNEDIAVFWEETNIQLDPLKPYPAGNHVFKVNNRNIKTSCVLCSKLTIKTPECRNFLYKNTSSQMLHWVLNTTLGTTLVFYGSYQS